MGAFLGLRSLGSWIAEGYAVSYDEMFPTRAVKLLTTSCHRTVEFQNLGAEGSPPIYSYRHLDEALNLKPDVIVMPLNPWDVQAIYPPEA